MGTKVQYKSYLPGNHPMVDLNDDSNSGTWPVYYGDKPSSNGQFHELYSQRTIADAYIGYHTEAVKQKILEHEAIFQTQLYELHRVYRVQRDLMDQLKMDELQKKSMAIETSMSSCSASQKQDPQQQHTSSAFWLSGSGSAKDLHSTPSFFSGSNPQNGVVSLCNAESGKDCEVEILDCMPSKARRKFNLELRADEYIDVEEPTYRSNKSSGNSRYPTYGRCENPPSSSAKRFIGGSFKIATLNNGQNGEADLNKKIQRQEQNSSSLNFIGCDPSFLSKSRAQTFPREFMQTSHHGRDGSRLRNPYMAPKENAMELSHMLNSAQSKGQTTVYSQNLLSEEINLYNKGQDASFFQTDRIKAEYWKERSESVPKHSVSGIDFVNRLSYPHQLDKSFSTSNGLWEKSGSCVTQKSALAEKHPYFNSTVTLPQSVQSSSKSVYMNGFCKESSAGFGPACYSTGSDYFNRSNSSFVASGLSYCQNGSINLNGLSSVDESPVKGIDLNIASIGDNDDSVHRNDQHRISDSQWLKSSYGVTRQIDGSGSSAQTLGVRIFEESRLSKGASSCRSSFLKEDEINKNGRIRGFDMNLSCESEEMDTETPAVSGKNFIDLNVCLTEEDDAELTASAPGCHQMKRTNRGFDLEAPGEIEEEDIIQLKRLRPLDSDEYLVNVAAEAIVGISSCRKLTVAETPSMNPPDAALNWFINEIISYCPDDADKVLHDKIGNDTEETDSVDYFEYMTLQLTETNEDEYLPDYPKPPEPEEPTGAGQVTTRTRKGQARRGKPRRDFKRDILPGLASLARHEVTEDLQTFGGLMRAMGHSWPSGIARARPRRGRPRLTPVQYPSPTPPLQKKTTTASTNNELITIDDHRNLTGWGKTTRRPRRQRCPTGNVSVLQIA